MQGNRRAQTCSELDFELCLRKITRKSEHNCLKNSYLKQYIWKNWNVHQLEGVKRKVSVSLFIPSKLTLWVWYIQLMTWLFFKRSILNLALSVFFFLKKGGSIVQKCHIFKYIKWYKQTYSDCSDIISDKFWFISADSDFNKKARYQGSLAEAKARSEDFHATDVPVWVRHVFEFRVEIFDEMQSSKTDFIFYR